MERRDFLRGSLAAAALVGTGTIGLLPSDAAALERATRRRANGAVRLNSNENPLGISDSGRKAILEGLDEANRYPIAYMRELQKEIAAFHQAPEGAVVLGDGSTEVIQMAVQTMAHRGARYVVPDPTFENVADYEAPFGLELVKVPLAKDWTHDIDRMDGAVRSAPGDVLVYVCNPNNPTSSLTSTDAVADWIRGAPDDVLFLVDEAYIHFVTTAGHDTLIPLALSRPNVVVTRTFSKIYGMAGMRLGYGVAHPDTAAKLRAFASDVSTNHLALKAGLATLRDDAWIDRAQRVNEQGRGILFETLDALGLERIPGEANFVMHRIAGDVKDYIARMAEAEIRVGRPFPPLDGWNRVSIGLPDEMERHSEALRSFRQRGWV